MQVLIQEEMLIPQMLLPNNMQVSKHEPGPHVPSVRETRLFPPLLTGLPVGDDM